ncbi:MAG: hypothetical protein IT370_26875 [Deltaproteobacteria bacterium]|nr:hypothetical protein [Deltaproteobacteria bacterium]
MLKRLVALLGLCLGCGGEPEGVRSDANQYVTRDGDGQVRFYLGDQVRKELRKSGRFVPAGGKRYQMVVVPERIVDALPPSGTRYLSACKAEHGVVIFNSVALDAAAAEDWQEAPLVDPYIRVEEHALTETYRSGDPGVYGFVTLQRGSREVSVGAQIELFVRAGEGYRDGALLLGDLSLPPAQPDETCKAPRWPKGG